MEPRRPVSPSRARGTAGEGVLVMGELLCDLFPPAPGTPLASAASLTPHLGGAPANVAVQVARLGVRAGLIGAVGTDPLGTRLRDELAREGVDTRGVRRAAGFRTGVTLVEVASDGERTFFPLVERRADLALSPDDVRSSQVRSFAAVHTGTVGLRAAGPRAAHRALMTAAHAAGVLVSLDVNLRWGMYPSRDALLLRARAALRRAHLVKATAEEARALLALSPRTGHRALAERLLARGPRLVLLTLDADGALLATRAQQVRVAAPVVDVVDATGAGDAFLGAALAWLVTHDVSAAMLDTLDARALAALGELACRAGSACCTGLGATRAMIRGTVR